MSGLESLAVLGLACNIMQIISFCRETTAIYKALSKDRSPHDSLAQNALHLQGLTLRLDSSILATTAPGSPTEEQREIQIMAQTCLDAALELQLELAKLGNIGKRSRLLTAIKSTWHMSRIEKLDKKMRDCQSILETSLLGRVCSSNDALAVAQLQQFANLDQGLKNFINHYSQGHRDMVALLKIDSAAIQNTIKDDGIVTRNHIDLMISRTMSQLRLTQQKADRNLQILKSLLYNGMNERYNQISPPDPETFQWALDSEVPRPHRDFADWLKTEHPIFWIVGKPGSGKSTLMKYLASSPQTKSILDSRHNHCLILSHFLWLAGIPIQRNLKGLFCSLLRQAIVELQEAIDPLIQDHPQILDKMCVSDWSSTELEQALFNILRRAATPICLFLDGLDEISQDEDHINLAQILERLGSLERVKVCVSSRPNIRFQKAISAHPGFLLQDLTYKDIRRLVCSELSVYARRFKHTESTGYNMEVIAKLISRKAEGVLLWVHFVLASVQRAFANRDSWDTILKRLSALPSSLHDLYKDMFARQSRDEQFYQQRAAAFFNIVLHGEFRGTTDPVVCMFSIAAATDESFLAACLDSKHKLTQKEISVKCEETWAEINAACAGLLEVESFGYDGEFRSTESASGETVVFPDSSVMFFHRTARDFLLETEDGRKIMQYDSWDIRRIAFLKACVARSRFYVTRSMWNAEVVLINIAHLMGPKFERPEVLDIVDTYHRIWYPNEFQENVSSQLRPTRPKSQISPRFIESAAKAGMFEYVRTQLIQSGASGDTDMQQERSCLLNWACRLGTMTNSTVLEGKLKLIDWLVGANENYLASTAQSSDTPIELNLKYQSDVERLIQTYSRSWGPLLELLRVLVSIQAVEKTFILPSNTFKILNTLVQREEGNLGTTIEEWPMDEDEDRFSRMDIRLLIERPYALFIETILKNQLLRSFECREDPNFQKLALLVETWSGYSGTIVFIAYKDGLSVNLVKVGVSDVEQMGGFLEEAERGKLSAINQLGSHARRIISALPAVSLPRGDVDSVVFKKRSFSSKAGVRTY